MAEEKFDIAFAEVLRSLFVRWDKSTSSDPEGWRKENPAWGQCAVTALVVQDYFGGEILRASLENVPGFEDMHSHYWNRLPDGTERDFSQFQFPADLYKLIPAGDPRSREYLLSNEDTAKRYSRLSEAVDVWIELFRNLDS